PTAGFQRFTVTNGTVIPSGYLVANPITGDRFFTSQTYAITPASVKSALYSVRTVLNFTLYTIVINGVPYTYESDADATNNEIVLGLMGLINADEEATWAANQVGGKLLISTTSESNISISTVTYLGADELTFDIFVRAVENGPIVAPAGTVSASVSSVAGVISTVNIDEFIVGRETETDAEYRNRLRSARSARGRSTVGAITTALLDTGGVTSATVYENPYLPPDLEGRPGKSFEAVVIG